MNGRKERMVHIEPKESSLQEGKPKSPSNPTSTESIEGGD